MKQFGMNIKFFAHCCNVAHIYMSSTQRFEMENDGKKAEYFE